MAVLLACAARAGPAVEAEPSRIVLGPKAHAEITVRTAGKPVRAVASVGTLTPASAPDGAQRWTWTPPPDARAPVLALFAFWDVDAPMISDVTVLGIPCAGRTELAIDTEPGARVTVEVGGGKFGPKRADPSGRLRLPVEVPPGVHEARVVAELTDQSKVRVLPLSTPPPSPWLVVLVPETSLDGRPVRALVVVPDSEESPGIELAVDGGRVEREQAAPNRVLARVVPDEGRDVAVLTARTTDGQTRASVPVPVAHAAAPPLPPAPAPRPARLDLGGAVGGFVGGGANSGPAVALTLGYGFRGLPLVAELELGLRGASLSAPADSLGVQKSSVVVFPVELGLRWELLAHRNFRLAVRTGGGILPGWHSLSSSFAGDLTEPVLGWEVFAALQAGIVAGPVEPYFELRGSLARTSTDHLDAHPGGGVFLVGIRAPLWSGP